MNVKENSLYNNNLFLDEIKFQICKLSLEDISINHKLSILNKHLAKAELLTIYNILRNENQNIKSLFLQQNDIKPSLFDFEEYSFNYFKSLISDANSYTKISCKEFDLSYKVVNKILHLKIGKELNANFIDLISLIYENSFYPLWFPFSKSADLISQSDKSKKVIYMVSNFPVISNRDFLVYGFGINSLKEKGSIFLLVRSIEENSNVFEDIFKNKQNKKYVRAEIKVFGFEIKVLGKNKIRIDGLINCDPKINFIPSFIMNQVIKQFAKQLFSRMVSIVQKYRGSKYENKNPSDMDKEFYEFIKNEEKEHFGIN